MKIALCFWGICRSTDKTIDSIKTNIHNVLKENDIEYDTYVHTYHISNLYSNERAGEPIQDINNDLYVLLEPNFIEIDDQEAVDKTLDLQSYKTHKDPWHSNYNVFDNHIRALYSLYKVTQLYKEKPYDYIIYLRPDVLYLNPISPTWFPKDNSISVPDFHDDCDKCPINDRFAICTKPTALIYGLRFKKALEYSKKYKLHSERFLLYILENSKTKINRVPFRFRRVRTTGLIYDLEIQTPF